MNNNSNDELRYFTKEEQDEYNRILDNIYRPWTGLSAVSLSKYIVSKCYQDDCPVTNIELQCLLYIIQRKFIACYMIAFFDDFEAWAFGAVVPNSYYRFCGFGAMPITNINYDINIEEKHKRFLDLIIETYRKYKPLELIDEVRIPNGAWETIYNSKNGKKIIPIELIKKDAIMMCEVEAEGDY